MTRFLLLGLLFLFVAVSPARAVAVQPTPDITTVADVDAQLSRANVEERLGRKLTLRERIGLGITRGKAKRQLRREQRAAERGTVQDGGRTTNGLAIAGFVCGVVGFFFGGLVLGPLAVVFSAIGLSRSSREGAPHKGLAIAGLVLGIIATAVILVAIGVVAG